MAEDDTAKLGGRRLQRLRGTRKLALVWRRTPTTPSIKPQNKGPSSQPVDGSEQDRRRRLDVQRLEQIKSRDSSPLHETPLCDGDP